MRRLADDLVLSFKDQIRTIRHSLRSEADAPGSQLPRTYRDLEPEAIGAVRTAIETPVLRIADELFTRVEHVTLGLLEPSTDGSVFPRPASEYLGRGDEQSTFTQDVYRESKALLASRGVRHTLVAETSIEALRQELLARHRDLIHSAADRRKDAATQAAASVQVCAAIAIGYARVRPIQKADLLGVGLGGKHLMIAPNLYVGLVLALAIALVSTRRDAGALIRIEWIESADAVVDARFERLKAAVDSKDAVRALGREFEAVLPFLP